jgi:hypothetical protein
LAASNAVPISVNAFVNEDAANTVMLPVTAAPDVPAVVAAVVSPVVTAVVEAVVAAVVAAVVGAVVAAVVVAVVAATVVVGAAVGDDDLEDEPHAAAVNASSATAGTRILREVVMARD